MIVNFSLVEVGLICFFYVVIVVSVEIDIVVCIEVFMAMI
jgi:hypothetical protein